MNTEERKRKTKTKTKTKIVLTDGRTRLLHYTAG